MPSVIHGGDEFTDLPEAPSATENGGTQAPYGISQHRTIVEEEGEKDGSLEATPSRTSENARLGTWYESCYHKWYLWSQGKN